MDNVKLDNIIPLGSIIRTKHPKSEWISNVVYKVFDNYIQIELTQDHINNFILVGDEVKCKCFGQEAEILLDAAVDSIDIGKTRLLTLVINKMNMFQNIRNYHRYDTYIVSRITIGRNVQVFCIVTSISSSGISVLSKSDFPLASEVYAEVFIDSGNILRFSGEIVRKVVTENGFEFGIKFSEIDKEDTEILDCILEELKAKDNSLIKKYLSSINS